MAQIESWRPPVSQVLKVEEDVCAVPCQLKLATARVCFAQWHVTAHIVRKEQEGLSRQMRYSTRMTFKLLTLGKHWKPIHFQEQMSLVVSRKKSAFVGYVRNHFNWWPTLRSLCWLKARYVAARYLPSPWSTRGSLSPLRRESWMTLGELNLYQRPNTLLLTDNSLFYRFPAPLKSKECRASNHRIIGTYEL